VLEDFVTEETSGDKAREQFGTMVNMEHIFKLIDRLEATLIQAKEEGKTPADILSNYNMVFTGPPGTGKTTAARKFGKVFFNLDLLPTDRVIETTGKTMLGQYVGQTENLVTEKMKEAKGGILFIDEAYGLFPSRGSYGGDALQALLDNITKPEFKGNLIIILAGYDKHIDALLGVNPGLKSRFDKVRLPFPSWTAQQSVDATVTNIERDNKKITEEAKSSLLTHFKILAKLPDWSSARDIFETVLPAMYTFRAERLAQVVAAAKAAAGSALTPASKPRSLDGAMRTPTELPPYEVSDVNRSCMPLVASRRKGLGSAASFNPLNSQNESNLTRASSNNEDMPQADDEEDDDLFSAPPPPPAAGAGAGAGGRMAAPPRAEKAPPQAKLKYKTLELDPDLQEGGEGDDGIPGLIGLLEEACAEKGYTDPTAIERFLSTGNIPKDVVELVWEKNGGKESKHTPGQVRTSLVKQSGPFLQKIKQLLKQMAEVKSAEEKRKQEKLKKIGKCCMGFEWIRIEGGYKCAGGTHFCTDEEIEQCEL
jgi:SpoVK/Ycf46/Vps4 family AAA+-type ATPase